MHRTRLTIVAFLALLALPNAFGSLADERRLRFYHTHTGAHLDVVYYRNGAYQQEALDRLDRFLCDWRNGKDRDIDPGLMDLLWDIQEVSGHHDVFEVISAYRSPETNEMLRGASSGVATNSQHLDGKAIDVRLRGLDTKSLHDTALGLRKGGVGYYAASDFVHIDTGRVRNW